MRECAAKLTLENGLSGEMGCGTFSYLTLSDSCQSRLTSYLMYFLDQISSGNVDISYVDETVKTILSAPSDSLKNRSRSWADVSFVLQIGLHDGFLQLCRRSEYGVDRLHQGGHPASPDRASCSAVSVPLTQWDVVRDTQRR